MTKQRRLGRGLEALLAKAPLATVDGPPPVSDEPATNSPNAERGGLPKIPVDQIDANPHQPRTDFDDEEIAQLAESIQEHGLIQPIVVRRSGDRYQLISGERRLRAALKAGWGAVAVHVIEADDRRMAELSIVENLQRKDLSPLEKAASFRDYLGRYKCTQEELAGRLKIDRSTIANLIRLLELPEPVQAAVRSGKISQGHARALLPFGDAPEQIAFCKRIEREGLSVRATEQLVHEQIAASDAEPLAVIGSDGQKRRGKRTLSPQIASLQQELRTALGVKVDIRQGSQGRGRLVIHFRNHEEFDRLRELLTSTGGAEKPKSRAV
ncbi:MAG: ParB/RepB/Spo0J family partition protein [Planctomycetes bacterium]|nr:ParB/RepB/Spo0J family partition protein [Planctomycetota bacterium]